MWVGSTPNLLGCRPPPMALNRRDGLTRSGALVIDTVVCLTLAKWETVSGRFGGYLTQAGAQFKPKSASTQGDLRTTLCLCRVSLVAMK
jgi:hypothetical protein